MTTREEDEKWMRRCLQLALGGTEHAAPNPMVGAVIVHRNRIIGEGCHIRCGEGHAEVNALRSVSEADRPLLRESTIYVSLEPCAHYGRTPPCARLIAETGIPRVVVGCIDPFARVQGRGIAILREAGAEVVTGVLEADCRALNRRFFTVQERHRPFVTLKWARSADGFLDRHRMPDEKAAQLSTPMSRLHTHRLRSLHEAIAVGHTTLVTDRPRLDVRHWDGPSPRRFVVGRPAPGELPAGFRAAETPEALLQLLQAEGVQTLLVEGGRRTLQSFLDAGLWDEAWEETAGILLGDGVAAPTIPPGAVRTGLPRLGADFTHYRNPRPAGLA